MFWAPMSEPTHRKVIIVGSGPAGYTAAIYAARASLAPLMVTGIDVGGQLMTTTDVENYPGYPKGVTGPDMMDELREQAERFGTELVYDLIIEADLSQRPFRLVSDGGDRFTCDALIISTGASAKYLGIDSEKRLANKGVTACATCDGHFYAGMEVAVVGGGDTAMEEAQYLTRMCTKVHLIHRRDSFRASKIMQQRTLDNPKIVVHWNSEVDEVLAREDERLGEKVGGVRLRDTVTGATREIAVEGFFLAIGHVPNSQVFRGQLDMDETGYLIVQPGTTRTKIPGVFAAGDVADKVYRQAVTAAGTGCMAAIDAERWLAEHG
jgi:thioredoxin reductase (NADPH)